MTFRRLLPLAPLSPALALIAFAAAGAAAQGLAEMKAPANTISDVQIGERGRLLRVAILCAEDCRVGARGSGQFFVPGIADDLDLDLKGRAKNAEALAFRAEAGGAALTIKSPNPIVTASIKRCVIDGAPASCIDMEFADGAAVAGASQAPGMAPEKAPEVLTPAHETQEAVIGQPQLREAPDGAKLIFASLAAPERFAPPAVTPPAVPTPPSADIPQTDGKPAPERPADDKPIDGPRLILDRRKAEALIGAKVDIGTEATRILGRPFGEAECARANEKLKADAWALDAMVDIGFCEASKGDLAAAAGVFERLLAYTPDNYEALVGRALIAAKKGERRQAEAQFQEALNALPPIAESDRIVAAMSRL